MHQDTNATPAPQGAPAGQPQPPPGSCAPPVHTLPPPGRTSRFLLPISCAIGCLPWMILGVIFLVLVAGGFGREQRGPHIALVRVSGLITAGESSTSFMRGVVSGAEDVVDQLEQARKNSDVKAVIIRLNTPGGSPAGSEEIYNAVRRLRADGRAVYASMGDVAASGGYYIAAACNSIFADSSTITGSIGVLYESADMSGLFKKIGLSPETIKSGKFKDTGSPARPLTPEERKLLQGIVDDSYAQFLKAVSDGRKMPEARVKPLADGRVFTGSQARKAGLVDEIGGLHEAVTAAARAAGIRGEPVVVEYRKRGFLESILGSRSDVFAGWVERAVERELLRRVTDEGGSLPWRAR